MLAPVHEPHTYRCRSQASLAAVISVAVAIAASGAAVQDQPKPKAEAPKMQALHYTGKVKELGTGKPIAGATVTVRRSILKRDQENRILQETRHPTGADGAPPVTIRPEQAAERYL